MDARTLCLGILTLGDASGYEIKKTVEEGPFSHFHQISYGSLYPALRKLLEEGLVTCREVVQEGRPDKKVYSVTEDGHRSFRDALHNPPERDHIRIDTLVYLFFGHIMEAEQRAAVFDGYLAQLKQQQAEMADWDLTGASPQRLFVHGFGVEYYKFATAYMERNRDVLFPDGEEEAAQ